MQFIACLVNRLELVREVVVDIFFMASELNFPCFIDIEEQCKTKCCNTSVAHQHKYSFLFAI